MEFDSLAPIAELTGGLARRPAPLDMPAERAPLPQNPAEVLAMLMDFSGSVALAELLHAPLPEGVPHPDADKLARKLRDKVRVRIESLLAQALKPLSGERAPALPTPSEIFAAIERAMANQANQADQASQPGQPRVQPDAAAAVRVAREIGAPLCAALGDSLRQAQAQLATLRWRIAPELRELGPRADRLERIDAALQRSIQSKLHELFDRMELAATQTFERACNHACATLPEGFEVDDLAGWVAEDGWIARYHERCVRMAQALFGHLQRSLEGLLLAAIDAEVV
ncbi:MAG: hypothetical protein ABW321_23140 [Polyangiales bacterium]